MHSHATQGYVPGVPEEDDTWKVFCGRRIKQLKETTSIPQSWWAKRYVMKLVSHEWRLGGKSTPRSGEGHGKSQKQLLDQVSGGKALSKVQATKCKGKLAKFKSQLKDVEKKTEKAQKQVSKWTAIVEKGNQKKDALKRLIESVESKLVVPKEAPKADDV